jgi:glycosyltransferase involved in cell wall biosynthesis
VDDPVVSAGREDASREGFGRSLSVFLPTYNERENIERAVGQAREVLEGFCRDFEIIIVDDGSRDGTSALADELARRDPRVRVVRHESNRGFGAALRSGIENSTRELIFYTDSDNQFDMREITRLLERLGEGWDMVVGFRIDRQDPPLRLFTAWIYNLMIRALFSLRVRDVDCSFKVFRREIFQGMRIRANTGLADAEILIKAQKAGRRFCEVGVRHYPRAGGATSYEMGRRRHLGLVRPAVVVEILREIRLLWGELK